MGTKNKPGTYDCYANAEPDEPIFVLLGRDPMAAELVRIWASMRQLSGEKDEKMIQEARECAEAMDHYANHIRKKNLVRVMSWEATLPDGREIGGGRRKRP